MILNELGERGLNGVLQSRLNMVGDAPAPSLVPEVQSSLVLESDRPEWSYFKGESLVSVFCSRAGAGATTTSLLLEAPRGFLLVITSIRQTEALSAWDLGWITTLPAYGATDTFQFQRCDARDTPLNGSSLVAGDTAVSPTFPFGIIGRIGVAADTLQLDGPFILADAKRALLLRATGTNATLRMNVQGYYRRLLPNELG